MEKKSQALEVQVICVGLISSGAGTIARRLGWTGLDWTCGLSRIDSLIFNIAIIIHHIATCSIEAALAHLGERQTEVNFKSRITCEFWRYCVRSTEAASDQLLLLLPCMYSTIRLSLPLDFTLTGSSFFVFLAVSLVAISDLPVPGNLLLSISVDVKQRYNSF
jgi:hypothetical protein